MEGPPPVANQIDLFMHFLGASRDGLVARRVHLDMISSSDSKNISITNHIREVTNVNSTMCTQRVMFHSTYNGG
jgi:hypothetical protein